MCRCLLSEVLLFAVLLFCVMCISCYVLILSCLVTCQKIKLLVLDLTTKLLFFPACFNTFSPIDVYNTSSSMHLEYVQSFEISVAETSVDEKVFVALQCAHFRLVDLGRVGLVRITASSRLTHSHISSHAWFASRTWRNSWSEPLFCSTFFIIIFTQLLSPLVLSRH